MQKKVRYLGTWNSNTLADNIIKTMADRVRENKGQKVKIRLTKDGLSLTKHYFLVGSSMTDYIRFRQIYYVTVNHYHPQCLLVIAKHEHDNPKDKKPTYQILAFRCENGHEVGVFVNFYKDMLKQTTHHQTENVNYELQSPDGMNWTLREKRDHTDKRQLSQLVDIHTTHVEKRNGEVHKISNGYSNGETEYNPQTTARAYVRQRPESKEITVTREVYEYDHERQNVSIQAIAPPRDQQSDSVSEASESSLRDELDGLSHELRDIKFMLEKSTGIGAEEYHTSPRQSTVKDSDPIDTVVIHTEDDDVFNRETTIVINGKNDGEVSAQVPDYRSSGTHTHVHRRYPQNNTVTVPTTSYSQWKGETLRADPANSRIWREEVHLRQGIAPRSSRPRSHYASTSSYASTINGSVNGSVRVPKGYVLVDNRQPQYRVVRGGTAKRINTNIQRPIEKVYTRPHSMHGSVSNRVSTHMSRPIVAEKANLYYTDIDHNQNNLRASVTDNESPNDVVVVKY